MSRNKTAQLTIKTVVNLEDNFKEMKMGKAPLNFIISMAFYTRSI